MDSQSCWARFNCRFGRISVSRYVAILLQLALSVNAFGRDECGVFPDGVEVRFVYIIDCSGSMSNGLDGSSNTKLNVEPSRHEVVTRELTNQIKGLPDGVSLQMCGFSSELKTKSRFGVVGLNAEGRRRAIASIRSSQYEPDGTTAVFEAVVKTLQDQRRWLVESPSNRYVRVIVLSDGEDSGTSRYKESDVLDELRKFQEFEEQFGFTGRLIAAEVFLDGPRSRAFKTGKVRGFIQGIGLASDTTKIFPFSVGVSSDEIVPHPVDGRSVLNLKLVHNCPELLRGISCPYTVTVEGQKVADGKCH